MDSEVKEYTVTIYTENQIGLLAQITNVFTRHGLSIWSLSAGATSMEGVHNITIVTSGSEKKVRESVQQIEKRVDVIKVFFYTADKIVYRELCLYKVPTPALLEYGDAERGLEKTHYAFGVNARLLDSDCLQQFCALGALPSTSVDRKSVV